MAEIVGNVKTPPLQPESVRLTMKERFETANGYLGLSYTEKAYEGFKEHYELVV